MNQQLIIFDFDGTLINSEPGILRAIELTVAEMQLPEQAVEQWRQLIGIPLAPQLAQVLPPHRQAEVEVGIAIYRRHYSAVGHEFSDPFAGIPQVLQEVQGRIPLAIASSKLRESILRVLQKWQWMDWFDPVISPAEVRHPKPHPESIEKILAHYQLDASQAVMVGDTEFDMEMARRAGVRAWGVGWGVHDQERLQQAGAERWFADPWELLAHLQGKD